MGSIDCFARMLGRSFSGAGGEITRAGHFNQLGAVDGDLRFFGFGGALRHIDNGTQPGAGSITGQTGASVAAGIIDQRFGALPLEPVDHDTDTTIFVAAAGRPGVHLPVDLATSPLISHQRRPPLAQRHGRLVRL